MFNKIYLTSFVLAALSLSNIAYAEDSAITDTQAQSVVDNCGSSDVCTAAVVESLVDQSASEQQSEPTLPQN